MDDNNDANEGRIIIFATDEMLNILRRHRHWMADGTFKVAPKFFLQLYTIHAIIGDGHVIPCVYALLSAKTQVLYDKMSKVILILDAIPDLRPK